MKPKIHDLHVTRGLYCDDLFQRRTASFRYG